MKNLSNSLKYMKRLEAKLSPINLMPPDTHYEYVN